MEAHRTFVKICGITNREDSHVAIESGANALGFIAVQESPRFVGVGAFNRIRDVLPPDIPLFVVVKRLSDGVKYGAHVIQYYERADIIEDLPDGTKTVQVIRVRGSEEIESAKTAPAHAVLLDAMHTAVLGGSGTRFEWSLAKGLRSEISKPFLLAGGLNPQNVTDALNAVQPHGVDAASGVEDKIPGAKDHRKVEEFLRRVREWDDRVREIPSGPAPSLFDILKSGKN